MKKLPTVMKVLEVEEVVEVGQIDPDEVCTPGVCVDMVVKL